jgi:hypothetical protein
MIKNKIFLLKQSLIDQEWHLTLEMSISEMAHAEKERENTPIKQHEDKVWTTKAQ